MSLKNKTISRGYILYYPTYLTFLKWQNGISWKWQNFREEISGCPKIVMVEVGDCNSKMECLCDDGKFLDCCCSHMNPSIN